MPYTTGHEMNPDSYDNDDEIADTDEQHDHDENVTAAEGGNADDADVTGFDDVEAEETHAESAAELPRSVSEAVVKQRIRENTAAALKEFNMKILNEKPLKAANDNTDHHRRKESDPLMELLNRLGDEQLIKAALHIRELSATAGTDAMGLSIHRPGKEPTPDYDLQRHGPKRVPLKPTTYYGVERRAGKRVGLKPITHVSGSISNVWFENGQTLDRKWNLDEEPDALRYGGKLRKAKKSEPISNGFDVNRDDAFAQRRIDAQMELDEIMAATGPLWKYIEPALFENATATNVGEETGAKGTQASGVGTAIIRIALAAAQTAIDRVNGDKSYRQYILEMKDSAPVSARSLKNALGIKKPSYPQRQSRAA
jgi:hypothetical protein